MCDPSLRKERHRKKILNIHIRGTHIFFCKTEVEERFIQVNSLTDVDEIRKQLSESKAVPFAGDAGPDVDEIGKQLSDSTTVFFAGDGGSERRNWRVPNAGSWCWNNWPATL